jgi:putative methyltransferase (TIGR04325 family)
MNDKLKKIIKSIVPPIMARTFRKMTHPKRYGFFGNYKSFEEAEKKAVGYDSEIIIEKVKSAALKVRMGEAVFDRDSATFDKEEYEWPLLASLLWIASRENNNLNIMDFGGALGSAYFQNKKWLSHLDVKWSIVEQQKFVDIGKKNFEQKPIRFFYTIKSCVETVKPNCALFSSVLPYVPKPYDILAETLKQGFKYIIIDRTPFLADGSEDCVSVEKVAPKAYDASYPAWFFNEKKILDFFAKKYELVAEFPALGGIIEFENNVAIHKGFLFERIK